MLRTPSLAAVLLPLLAATLSGRRERAHNLAIVVTETEELLLIGLGGGAGAGLLAVGGGALAAFLLPTLLALLGAGAAASGMLLGGDDVVVVLLEEAAHAGDVLALVDHGADLAEVGGAAAQGELEVVELEFLAAGDLGVAARLEAHALEELGHDLVEYADRLGEGRLDIPVGEEQTADCSTGESGEGRSATGLVYHGLQYIPSLGWKVSFPTFFPARARGSMVRGGLRPEYQPGD